MDLCRIEVGRQGTRAGVKRCHAEPFSRARSLWDARQFFGFWGYRYLFCCSCGYWAGSTEGFRDKLKWNADGPVGSSAAICAGTDAGQRLWPGRRLWAISELSADAHGVV